MGFDYALFSFINGFAGGGGRLDWFIIFFADSLPYILIILLGHLILLRPRGSLGERIGILALALGAAAFARFLITGMIWRLFERPRPFLSHDVNQLLFVDAPSFPSGHSTFMFAFSTVIYLYDKRLGAVMYAGTVLIVLSRIAASVHYPSDILGGALIGAGTGYLAFRYLAKRFERYGRQADQDRS